MTRRRFGLPPGLIWWAIPFVDIVGYRIFFESMTGGSMNPVLGVILVGTTLMINALAVAAVLRIRRGPIPGLLGFLVGGILGVAIFAAMTAIAPEWVAWRMIAIHRAFLWMQTDPDLAARAILPPIAILLGPQVVPALIGFAIDWRYRGRPVVDRRSAAPPKLSIHP